LTALRALATRLSAVLAPTFALAWAISLVAATGASYATAAERQVEAIVAWLESLTGELPAELSTAPELP